MTPTINKRRCPAQDNICKVIQACPSGAIAYVEDKSERMGGKIVIDAAKCDDCGICIQECCGHAIESAVP